MDIPYFTYITGLASLVGLIIQIFNLFPEQKKILNPLMYLFLGVFVGSLSPVFTKLSISFDFKLSMLTMLIIINIVLVLLLILISFFIKNGERRHECYGITGFSAAFLACFLLAAALGTAPSSVINEGKITISEMFLLVENSEKAYDYESAIKHLETIKSRLSLDDPRYKVVAERINKDKLKQVK